MSADGQVAVGVGLNNHPTRWLADGTAEDLGLLPGTTAGVATAANFDGSVVVGYCGGQAFRWTSTDGLSALPTFFGAYPPVPVAVSDDGNVIAGSDDDGNGWGWILRNGAGVKTIDSNYSITAMSRDGQVFVGYGLGGLRSFIMRADEVMRDLRQEIAAAGASVQGWKLRPLALSADGNVLAGSGTLRNAEFTWIARLNGPLPSPAPAFVLDFPWGSSESRPLQLEGGTVVNATRLVVRPRDRAASVSLARRPRADGRFVVRIVFRPGARVTRLLLVATGPGGRTTIPITVRRR